VKVLVRRWDLACRPARTRHSAPHPGTSRGDERERANVAKRFPGKLDELKRLYAAWEATLPPIPEDAKFSLVYGPAELPNPS